MKSTSGIVAGQVPQGRTDLGDQRHSARRRRLVLLILHGRHSHDAKGCAGVNLPVKNLGGRRRPWGHGETRERNSSRSRSRPRRSGLISTDVVRSDQVAVGARSYPNSGRRTRDRFVKGEKHALCTQEEERACRGSKEGQGTGAVRSQTFAPKKKRAVLIVVHAERVGIQQSGQISVPAGAIGDRVGHDARREVCLYCSIHQYDIYCHRVDLTYRPTV